MTESNSTPGPLRKYSKSSEFYHKVKIDFFRSNATLLATAEAQNAFFARQPARSACKLCSMRLQTAPDFSSHHVNYVFCDHCGHLNGMHIDTEKFVNSLYIDADGSDYAKGYADEAYLERATHIYVPKFNFLRDHLPAKEELSILDIGCGAGYLVFAAVRAGVSAMGLDVGKASIDFGNGQIQRFLGVEPLQLCAENDFIAAVGNSQANVVCAIGVIEHLRDMGAFLRAFTESRARYLLYSVPMFSLSVIIESIFRNVFPRQLAGGHTHLFTERSIEWLHREFKLMPIAEWRFGEDIMDLYRSMRVEMENNSVSSKVLAYLDHGLKDSVDEMQTVLDRKHFCAEIHCLVSKA